MSPEAENYKWLKAALEHLEIPIVAWAPYGALIYPFLKMFLLKLIDTNLAQQERLFAKPISFSAYILPVPDRNRIITFFEKDARLQKLRERFPKNKRSLKKADLADLRRYYYVLFPVLVLKRALLVKVFENEIAHQEYDRIIETFPGWLFQNTGKLSSEQIVTAGEIWSRVARILLDTCKEMGVDLISEKNGMKVLGLIEERLWSELGIE